MSDLSNIRTLQDLEHQRALLQLKVAQQEQKVRRDIDDIKRPYTIVTNAFTGIRSGVSRIRLILPLVLPVIRFIWNIRSKRKR